jgi:hypothetical protein
MSEYGIKQFRADSFEHQIHLDKIKSPLSCYLLNSLLKMQIDLRLQWQFVIFAMYSPPVLFVINKQEEIVSSP